MSHRPSGYWQGNKSAAQCEKLFIVLRSLFPGRARDFAFTNSKPFNREFDTGRRYWATILGDEVYGGGDDNRLSFTLIQYSRRSCCARYSTSKHGQMWLPRLADHIDCGLTKLRKKDNTNLKNEYKEIRKHSCEHNKNTWDKLTFQEVFF